MKVAWHRFALASACALVTAFPRGLAACRLAIVPALLCMLLVQPAEAASAAAQPAADGAMAGMDGDDGPVWAATTAFSFVDAAGKPVTDAAFRGRFLLLHLNDGPAPPRVPRAGARSPRPSPRWATCRSPPSRSRGRRRPRRHPSSR